MIITYAIKKICLIATLIYLLWVEGYLNNYIYIYIYNFLI